MNKQEAFALFDELISIAENELIDFTLNTVINSEQKADKSVVTACDKRIDEKLTAYAHARGLQVVSEEGKHVTDIVRSGNYITIDPIDGTLGYIDYVNAALEKNNISQFLDKDLGPEHDFSLLLGIVENGVAQFGACYNYVTKEKILIDGNNKNNLFWQNKKRDYAGTNAAYLDPRPAGDVDSQLISMNEVTVIKQATVGLKSLYAVLNSHESSVMAHTVQTAGLWDILPAAVATRAFGGIVYDGLHQPLVINQYIVLPGKGALVLKGEHFKFLLN